MAERERNERLQALFDSGVEVFSISKLDSINNCPYGAYRTYRLHEKGENNVYAMLGGKIHDTLEKITHGECVESDLLPAMKEELEDLEMMGINFPKSRDGSDGIKDGWVANMTHFCETYKAPKGKDLTTEEFFLYTTSEGYPVQGYIDLQSKNSDGTISIYDYKTSSMYSKADLPDHGRQLLTYTLGKEQEGETVKSVAWIMLKYVDIEFMGKKTSKSKEKTKMVKTIERKKIAQEMEKYVTADLVEAGYDGFEIEEIVDEFKNTNKFDCLPEEIRKNYKMKPCVMKYPITDENKAECEDYINRTAKMWQSLGDDESNYPPRKFTKVQKNGKEVPDIFFCTALCQHFKNCYHIHDYLDQLAVKEDDEDSIFS